jgi:hypothetical protein
MRKPIIYSIIVLLLLSIIVGYYKDELNKKDDKIGILSLKVQTLDSFVNKQGKTIKEQEVISLKDKETLKDYTDSIFDLKNKNERKVKEVHAYYKNKIRVVVDTFTAKYTDTIIQQIPCLDSLNLEYVIVPKDFEKVDSFYTIQGTVKKEGIDINNFEMKDSIYGRFITEKGGIFKADKIKYQTFNTNPYIKIEGSESAIYKPPKKTFLNKVKTAAIYIGIGFLIGTTL